MKHYHKSCLSCLMAVSLAATAFATRPAAPSDLSLKFDAATVSVSGSVKAPETADYSSDYAPLDRLTSLTVERMAPGEAEYTQVESFINPQPGAVLQFTDPTVAEGISYTYRAIADIDDETSNAYGCMRTLFTGILPGTPTNLSASTDKGNPPVTISFDIPTIDDGGNPLDSPVTEVTIERNENFGERTTVATISDIPEDGHVVYADNTAEADHKYMYFASAATRYGKGYAATVQVKTSADTPGPVKNLKAKISGTDVILTWDAPTSGASGGYIDPQDVTYSVRRIINGEEDTELITGLKETTYTDDRSGLTSETVYTYRVTPSNAQGEGSYEQIRDLIVGPPASLPYSEDFNGGVEWNKAPENNWESGSNKSWGSWGVSTSGYYGPNYESVAGANPEISNDGYAWAQYTQYADNDVRDWYMTGRVSMKEAENPVMSVYVIKLPIESTSTLTIEVVDAEGNSTALEEIAIAGDEYTWEQHSYSLERWCGADWIKLRFTSFTGTNPSPVGFDLLTVSENAGEHKSQFAVEGIRYYVKDEANSEVSVIGYPGDDVNAVIPMRVSHGGTEYTVTEIADQAFYNMPALASIKIPGSVTRIGDMAFWGDTGLSAVEFSDGLKSIGEGAFLYCNALNGVSLPATLETIGSSAFAYCKSLDKVDIPAGITELPSYIFNFCDNLTSVELPSTMTKIGYQAFCEALSLKNVEIPAGVNYIGAFAFENTAIEKVTIPAGVTDILNATFSGCASLADVTFISEAPPTVDKSAFEGIAQPCTGHCPEDTEELYQSTPGLEGITFKKASGISTPEIDANESVMLYDMSGRRVAPASYYGPAISIRTKDGHRICRKVMR